MVRFSTEINEKPYFILKIRKEILQRHGASTLSKIFPTEEIPKIVISPKLMIASSFELILAEEF